MGKNSSQMKWHFKFICGIMLIFIILIYVSQVNAKRSNARRSGKKLAHAFMAPWNKFTRKFRGPIGYKYWHHKQDKNGKWHKRKYADSDDSVSSESSEFRSYSDSRSDSRENTKNRRYKYSGDEDSRSRSFSDSKEQRRRSKSRLTNLQKQNKNKNNNSKTSTKIRTNNVPKSILVGEPLVAQAFMFFIDNFGCKNLTAFQTFMASYNIEAATDKELTMNDQDGVLKRMSRMAQEELDANKQCERTCSQ